MIAIAFVSSTIVGASLSLRLGVRQQKYDSFIRSKEDVMVKRLPRVFLALLVLLSATSYAPPAQALPNEIYTEYYDCNVAFV